MKRIILLFLLIFSLPLLADLPKHVLLAWRTDLSATKQQKIITGIENMGLEVSTNRVWMHTPTSNKWIVACFWTEHFKGKISQQKIQDILDAVADANKVKIEFTDNPLETLRTNNLVRWPTNTVTQ